MLLSSEIAAITLSRHPWIIEGVGMGYVRIFGCQTFRGYSLESPQSKTEDDCRFALEQLRSVVTISSTKTPSEDDLCAGQPYAPPSPPSPLSHFSAPAQTLEELTVRVDESVQSRAKLAQVMVDKIFRFLN